MGKCSKTSTSRGPASLTSALCWALLINGNWGTGANQLRGAAAAEEAVTVFAGVGRGIWVSIVAMDVELLKKEIRYRASRRGLKELDVALAAYVNARLEGLDADSLLLFRDFLLQSESDLTAWLVEGAPAPAAFGVLVADIQTAREQARQRQGGSGAG